MHLPKSIELSQEEYMRLLKGKTRMEKDQIIGEMENGNALRINHSRTGAV